MILYEIKLFSMESTRFERWGTLNRNYLLLSVYFISFYSFVLFCFVFAFLLSEYGSAGAALCCRINGIILYILVYFSHFEIYLTNGSALEKNSHSPISVWSATANRKRNPAKKWRTFSYFHLCCCCCCLEYFMCRWPRQVKRSIKCNIICNHLF